MSLAETFPVNSHIELRAESDSSQRFYPSRVEDVDESELLVAAPLYRRSVIRFGVGSRITIFHKRPEGLYAAVGRVKAEGMRPTPLILLSVPEKPQRFERRQYVRIPVLVSPVEITIQGDEDGKTRAITGTMIDLSGGGMGIRTAAKVAMNTVGIAGFTMPGVGQFRVPVEVVRVIDEGLGYSARSLLGCRFGKMSNLDRERVVRFLWKEQAKLRRKGLL